MRAVRNLLGALILPLLLAQCATAVVPVSEWPADKMYKEAKASLKAGDYQTAIEYFENLQTRYPFGNYAQQALLYIAYAYYRFDETESAIAAADRFIKLHPRHPRVDYAYYLKGLANFKPSAGPLDDLFNQDAAERDTAPLHQSFKDFSELLQRFPDSAYAQDARNRMIYLRNSLARNELRVAHFYFKRKAYIASSNRCKYIIETYQGTPSVKAALELMVQSYDQLGMNKARDDARRVLELNYPKSKNAPAQATESQS